MCLIVLLHRVHPDAPVIFAANRDEFRERPSESMQLLEAGPPRIAGGRDLSAGGTWMAIGEHGVIAGLTNQRGPEGPDSSRRSRGELPLVLARAESADEAAERAREIDAPLYNPCTLFVADAESAHYVELWDSSKTERLEPGVHILENRLRGTPSPKAEAVAVNLDGVLTLSGDALRERLEHVLSDPTIPEAKSTDRPAPLNAARVDLGSYGTRSATLVFASVGSAPRIWHVDTPPGDSPFTERTPF
ncbi:MAG: NRDE family protein [Myxococcota bacterium]